MRVTEMKFLFEGIVFPSQVFVDFVSNSLDRCEITVTFFTKYLIYKYQECYFFVLENNNFKSIYTTNEKEDEFVKTLQEAVREVYSTIKKSLCITEESLYKIVL
jgi:hypothetical protein